MLLHRSVGPALALVLTLGGLAGCGSGSNDGRPEVVASFYPLQYVAERIVGNHAQVTNLTQPGVEPHDLELTPRQTAKLSGAAVVVYEKGLQPAVDEAVSNAGPDHVVDAAEALDLSGGESGGKDPHFWLDPTLLGEVARDFTTSVAKADPQHADDYRAANETLQRDLTRLDQDMRTGLQQCTSRTLVVSHDAFGYLARRYDLEVRPIAGLSPGAEPSPRHLAELADLIREDGITTVFSERLASAKLADTLASDLGIKTAVLDPIEGLASSESKDDYLDLMRQNLVAIQKGVGCS